MVGIGRAPFGSRGILFTSGLAIFSMSLITLAALFITHTGNMRGTGGELAGVERVSYTYESIEKAARDVFEKSSGIAITSNTSTITFTETLPNALAPEYDWAIEALESFAESYANQSGAEVSMDTSESRDTMPLRIGDYGITVSHTNYGGNDLIVSPESINFEAYEISLRVPANVTCSSNFVPGSNFTLRISVTGDYGSSCYAEQTISAAGSSAYKIANNSVVVNVTNGVAFINTSLDGVKVEFAIVFGNLPEGMPVYSGDVIIVSSASPAASKSSRVRLL